MPSSNDKRQVLRNLLGVFASIIFSFVKMLSSIFYEETNNNNKDFFSDGCYTFCCSL